MMPVPGRGDPTPYAKRVVRTTEPTRYWALVRAPLREPGDGRRWPGTLVLMSSSFRLGGLLFDSTFYRPDPARRRETGGTGLGLAIVKTCVEACGGTVTCANRQPHGLQCEIVLERA